MLGRLRVEAGRGKDGQRDRGHLCGAPCVVSHLAWDGRVAEVRQRTAIRVAVVPPPRWATALGKIEDRRQSRIALV